MRSPVTFWICVVLVLVNVGLVFFAPTDELMGAAFGRAGYCGLIAFVCWLFQKDPKRPN